MPKYSRDIDLNCRSVPGRPFHGAGKSKRREVKRFTRLPISIAVGFSLLVALVGCGGSAQDSGSTQITWATGTTGGAYYHVTSAASAVMRKHSDTVQVQPQATGGSIENMRLLKQGDAQLASTSAETPNRAFRGKAPFKKPFKTLRAVAAGNSMLAHIMVRADSDIHSFSDLDGKRISTGAPGSATHFVAATMLKKLGITKYRQSRLEHEEAATALTDGTIDAMIPLSGIPFPAASELVATTDVRFVPLTGNEIQTIREDNSYWTSSKLPAGSYKGQSKPVPALGVPTLVVASSSVSKSAIREILNVLYAKRHKAWVTSDKIAAEYSTANTKKLLKQGVFNLPFHPGAKTFFREQGVEIK